MRREVVGKGGLGSDISLCGNVENGGFKSSNHRLPRRCNSILSAETHKAQWGYQVAQSAYPWRNQRPGWHQPNQLDERRARTHSFIQKKKNKKWHALIQNSSSNLRPINVTIFLSLKTLNSHQNGRYNQTLPGEHTKVSNFKNTELQPHPPNQHLSVGEKYLQTKTTCGKQ